MLPESARFLKSAVGWLPAWGIFLQPLAFLFFSLRRLLRPNGSRLTYRKASRNSLPVITWDIPAVNF